MYQPALRCVSRGVRASGSGVGVGVGVGSFVFFFVRAFSNFALITRKSFLKSSLRAGVLHLADGIIANNLKRKRHSSTILATILVYDFMLTSKNRKNRTA